MKHDEWSRIQGSLDGLEVAHDEGDRLVARLVLDPVADDPAVAIAGRQIGLGDAMNQLLAQRGGT